MLGVGATDVLLHGAIPLLLCSMACYSQSGAAVAELAMTWVLQLPLHMATRRGLTPVQRLRQAELSWLRSGQTTTLFSSETEKDPVSEARGGMASIYPPCLCERVGRPQE